jgi:lipopolysaccharide/colanic/teichoic acid biosynthesis glycosyltransferase/glycosyltransferase involved in cell wall biosynthesis
MSAIKIAQVTAADITVKKLLLPLITRLRSEGYEVHSVCSDGKYVSELKSQGYTIHVINIDRKIAPFSNLKSLLDLYRLMKEEQFDVVHVHTPIAAVLGRIAAWLARTPIIIYTAHGFYFHENMNRRARTLVVWMEKLMCQITDLVFTQSNEDAVTAIREHICAKSKVICIGNGVDIKQFSSSEGNKQDFGLTAQDKVVGFVGRVVREKGIVELIESMKMVVAAVPDAKLVVVGDTLASDRDQECKKVVNDLLQQNDLASHVVFAGFREDIPRVMASFDVYVLPSYREGMPRTIIEAMASGKPVVATNIRGCREEVVEGKTGLLVPVNDSTELAKAIIKIISNPDLACEMGAEGKRRAGELFDENLVLDKQVKAYSQIVKQKFSPQPASLKEEAGQNMQHILKRSTDIIISLVSLTILLIPFTLIGILVKIDSRGPVFFKQERVGKNGKSFLIWKFRTMVDGAIKQGLGVTVAKGDSRITRMGKLMRGGIDELPQLINVLKGEMSIVGPRPTLRYQVELYDDFQKRRLLVKPGITSLAVVKGRNFLSWKERIDFDVWYVEHWSFLLDIKIIIGTFWAVLVTRKGVYGAEGINDDFLAKST